MRVRGLKHPYSSGANCRFQSHPMRVRGLKLLKRTTTLNIKVAPHAGAWIETLKDCVLKSHIIVAPHAGAWIETSQLPYFTLEQLVAPHAGAWIETTKYR